MKGIRDLEPSADLRAAVIDLWDAVSSPQQARCQRLYVEAAALGVLGTEPFASVVAEANEVWLGALADHLVASGIQPVTCSARGASGGGGLHGPAARRATRAAGRGAAQRP